MPAVTGPLELRVQASHQLYRLRIRGDLRPSRILSVAPDDGFDSREVVGQLLEQELIRLVQKHVDEPEPREVADHNHRRSPRHGE